jgi:predicted HAD superfamily Cof-like phosphohydrolase
MIDKIRNEWNAKVDVPMNDKPTVIHRDQGMLMFHLMYEELLEFKYAVQDEELTEKEKIVLIADALADVQYLLFGAVNQYGLQGVWDDIMKEVHRSNLTKIVDGKLLKNDDGKVVKQEGYKPPNLKSIIFGK